MKARQGEVWLADLGLAAKVRPVLIVSRDDPDPPRALILYVPFTRQFRRSPYEVDLGQLRFLDEPSYANVQGLGSIAPVRLQRFLGKIPPDLFTKVRAAISFAMEL
jgi:mRNA interferase MazF